MPGVTTAYQSGTHASRPAADSGCILYACDDHGLVYRSDGSSWTTWATLGSAGGGALSRIGTTSVGGSTEQTTANREYAKSISVPGEGVILSVGVYLKTRSAGANTGTRALVHANNGGAFGDLIAQSQDLNVLTASSGTPTARWLYLPVNAYVPSSGTYWIGIHVQNTSLDLHYAAGGSDRYNANTYTYGWDGQYNAQTDSTRDYSMHAVFLAA